MKLTALSVLLGALGVSSVWAAPTDFAIVSGENDESKATAPDMSIFRFGLAVPPREFLARLDEEVRQAQPFIVPSSGAHHEHHPHMHKHHRHGCKGKLRVKMMKLSNKIRGALGLPLIDIKAMHHRHAHGHHHHHGHHEHKEEKEVKNIHWAVVTAMKAHGLDSNNQKTGMPKDLHRANHIHAHHRLRDEPFITRLTHSLLALGKWEGRAVAFVIGCGLGVLLRMVWVMAVLVVRGFRGPKEKQVQLEDVEVESIVFEVESKEALPRYPVRLRTDEEIDEERHLIKNLKEAGLI